MKGVVLKNKSLNFKSHHKEVKADFLQNFSKSKPEVENHKTSLWNAFVDSDLSDITLQDCSIYPRILPGSYLPVINKTAKDATEFVLKLLSMPENEMKAILPEGPIRNFLINELKVIKHRPDRMVGSFRFDMAIVGEPVKNNPPKILELNEIGFDGLSRMPFIQDSLFKIMPKLKKEYFALDTSNAEINNMKRLGNSLARFQPDSYNWDEECLLRKVKDKKFDLRLITPAQYGMEVEKSDYPFLTHEKVVIKDGKLKIGKWMPESYMVSIALTLEDYIRDQNFYSKLVREKVPHYGPFLTGLIATKSILTLFDDKLLRRKLLNRSSSLDQAILGAKMFPGNAANILASPEKYVLKHVDGFGGEQVYMGEDLIKQIKKIKQQQAHEWMVQDRVKLNTIEIDGILSRPKTAICDLGVFVQYDWSQGKFNHFEVGGFLSRATSKSYKVNISSGGAQVAVMFSKKS
jgi:hypothetical protein